MGVQICSFVGDLQHSVMKLGVKLNLITAFLAEIIFVILELKQGYCLGVARTNYKRIIREILELRGTLYID